jgi:hypothetical protein
MKLIYKYLKSPKLVVWLNLEMVLLNNSIEFLFIYVHIT